MTIKQLGGVFGRNPTFNDVTIEGELTFDGDIDVNSDLKVDGDLEVTGTIAVGNSSAAAMIDVRTDAGEYALRLENGSGYYFRVADGGLTEVGGNVKLTTAGSGIDFSATSGTGTSELFDDYEEGTYTADLYEAGGSTLDAVTGYYTKIGNVVTIHVESVGGTTGGSGAVRSNLPFTSAHPASNTLAYSASNGNAVACFVLNSGTYLEFVDTVGAIGGGNKMIGSDVWSGSRTYFSLTYITSD